MSPSLKRWLLGLLLAAVLVFSIVIALNYLVETSTEMPIINPRIEIPIKPPLLLWDNFSPRDQEVVQGSTCQINITFTSWVETELPLAFEDLYIMSIDNTHRYSSTPQAEIFNYTFNPNPVLLEFNVSKSTLLTMNFAEDAPTGKYLLYVKYGSSELTHLGGNGFGVTIFGKVS